MPRVIQRPASSCSPTQRVTPSRVDPSHSKPFTLDQELESFCGWVGDPIWAPPMDSTKAMANSMLKETRPFTPSAKRWNTVLRKHRSEFTQVREIELYEDSIRLPKGRFFVSVTEQDQFDKITETIPACVQTRLDEFLCGPGKRSGAKVYYLKPLCVEVGDDLILTTREDLMTTIKEIQDSVFAEYDRRAPFHRTWEGLRAMLDYGTAIPRRVIRLFTERRQRAIKAYQARLEFKRRKTALGAAKLHQKCRTNRCTFDEMLALTNPLQRAAVIEQYAMEKKLSGAQRRELIRLAAGSSPWFVTLSFGVSLLSSLSWGTAPAVVLCDPAFVAEMPESPGVLLKIGHFDIVGGVTHVEI